MSEQTLAEQLEETRKVLRDVLTCLDDNEMSTCTYADYGSHDLTTRGGLVSDDAWAVLKKDECRCTDWKCSVHQGKAECQNPAHGVPLQYCVRCLEEHPA